LGFAMATTGNQQEYIIYCDESSEKGRYFSDFFGGVLVKSEHLDEVKSILAVKKKDLHFNGEVKWGKIPGNKFYAQKYINLMDCFFDLVAAGKIKVRIMFRQNTIVARHLTPEQIEQKYFILYYMFLKWAFGLDCSPVVEGGVNLRIYPDQIPDTKEQVENFRSFLVGLARRSEFRAREIRIKPENVTDVRSHEHDILQCLDIVLGAMHFWLNDLNKETKPGKKRREKRTRQKELVYRRINARIRAIYPNFNIGVSTGRYTEDCRWSDPYRHWLIKPRKSNRVVLPGSKKKRKKAP
jgi:hypothetical protein